MSRPSTESIYVVRVVSRGNGEGALPSERRYSATTVGGVAAVHAFLALTLLLLGALHVAFAPSHRGVSSKDEASFTLWPPEAGSVLVTLSASSWVVAAVCVTIGPVVTGVLAWKQWYLEANLRRFLCSSVVAFALSSASAAITTATLLLQQGAHMASPVASCPPGTYCEGQKPALSLLPPIAVNAALAAALEALACLASLRIAWAGVRKREDVKEERPTVVTTTPRSFPPIRIAPDIVPCESSREYEERMRRFVADAGVAPETVPR